MRRRKLLVLCCICLAVSFVVVSFDKVVYPQVLPTETLHIGATVPFQSRLGIQLKNILYMNADLLNKAGGLTVGGKTYKIEYHIYDDKYSADGGRAAIEKLVYEDKIKFNVGTFAAAPTIPMLRVTEQNKIPFFGGAVSEKCLSPEYKYFTHNFHSKHNFGVIRVWREIRPEIKRVLVCTYDDEGGHATFSQESTAYKHYGFELLPPFFFKHGETDFTRIAIKAVTLKPDLFVMSFIIPAEYVLCTKALREAGYTGAIKMFSFTQRTVDEMVGKIGKDGVEGIYLGIYDPTFPGLKITEEGKEFRKNYEKYYGTWETDGIMWSYAWYNWLAAVKKADSIDPDKVMAAINKDFLVPTPFGTGKFFRRPDLGNDRYCDYASVFRGGVVKNGTINFLFERDADYMIDAMEAVYGVKMR